MKIYRVYKETLAVDVLDVDITVNGYYIDNNEIKYPMLSSIYVYFEDIKLCQNYILAKLLVEELEYRQEARLRKEINRTIKKNRAI